MPGASYALPRKPLPYFVAAIMNLLRQILCSFAVVGICLALPAHAETFPARPIKVIVPFAAASATDVLAREIGARLSTAWGQPVVVDNRPGASGMIAAAAAAKAPADGYTLFFTSNTTQAANPSLFRKLPYDPEKDFAPVSTLAVAANLLVVRPELGLSSVRELIRMAREQPGRLSFAHGSSLSRLNGEMLRSMAGIDIVPVPYKSNPQGVTDLLGGQVQLMFTDSVTALPHVKAGKLKALGITSGRRSALMPDVPTIAEAGVPGYELTGWLAVFAPAGTPEAVLGKTHAEIQRILELPAVRERILQMGLDPWTGSRAELGAMVRAEIPKWARIVKEAGIQPE